MDRYHPTDHTGPGGSSAAAHPAAECRAIVEPSDSDPDLCTIYSVAPEDSLTTAWLSAQEGSYCTLEEHR
ncbi:hypothetical protein B1756_00070 [Natrarchaeobaculum aegyptiacum]|uniref:DUF7511 domain-containing protein n=1 Tax=Natrarchaeobaculum aegyptiacum TaxID=745377 RepID=A0A2Z2HWH4_9EURY|nr:hypothetical protein B1756_00070 [Natrarchaeobaculum aegyptiacum]